MKHSGQVVIAGLLFIGLMVYITVSGHIEEEKHAKWVKSFKTTEMLMDLNCNISSMRYSTWYRCASNEGIQLGEVSFVQLSSYSPYPLSPDSKLTLNNVKIQLEYSVDFKCVIKPFTEKTTILNLVQLASNLCLPDSLKLISKIREQSP